MERSKQIRILETKGRYKVVNGRLHHCVGGVWKEKACATINGYRQHQLFNGRGWGKVVAYEHSIVWIYEHGPYKGVIDHLNKDRSDNRIENLEAVSVSENKLRSPNPPIQSTYSLVNSGNLYRLFDSYCSGLSKTKSAHKAGICRCNALYHFKRLIQEGVCTYLGDDVRDGFLARLPEKDKDWRKMNEVRSHRKCDQ
jgi:hypothetical protein